MFLHIGLLNQMFLDWATRCFSRCCSYKMTFTNSKKGRGKKDKFC